MLKNVKLRLLTKVASLLTLVALTEVSTNSIWYLYEPEVPKSLKNKE